MRPSIMTLVTSGYWETITLLKQWIERRGERGRLKIGGGYVEFSELLDAVAKAYGVEPSSIERGARERVRSSARAMLVYLGREWSGMKTNELARLLHCDPSMISRIYRRYAEKRDQEKEEELARLLGDLVNIHA